VIDYDVNDTHSVTRLRYERISPGGEVEALERDWHLHHWSQGEFRQMLESGHFESITARDVRGETAAPDAVFVIFQAQIR
jgi:hypothetical protein